MDIIKILKEEQKEYKNTLLEDIQDNAGASVQMTAGGQSASAATLFPTAYSRTDKKITLKRIPTRSMEEFMLFLQQMQQQMQDMEQQQQQQQPQQQQEAFTISSLRKGLGSLVVGGALAMSPNAQGGGVVSPQTTANHQEEHQIDVVSDLLVPHLKQAEGFKPRRYNDTKKNPTIGHGALIDSSLNGTLETVFPYQSKEWRQKIMSGGTEMTRAQAHDLLVHQARKKHDEARDLIGHETFDSMDPELRMHLASEHFRGMLAKSPTTLKHIRNGDLKAASKEYLDADEYRANLDNSIGQRMESLSKVLAKNHGKVKIVPKVDHTTDKDKKKKK